METTTIIEGLYRGKIGVIFCGYQIPGPHQPAHLPHKGRHIGIHGELQDFTGFRGQPIFEYLGFGERSS